MGDSVCAIVTIVSDIFVETEETFEVSLLPDPEDMFTAVITPGMGMATIIITDGEENSSKLYESPPIFWANIDINKSFVTIV